MDECPDCAEYDSTSPTGVKGDPDCETCGGSGQVPDRFALPGFQQDVLRAENARLQADIERLDKATARALTEIATVAESVSTENVRLRTVAEAAARVSFLYESRLATDADLLDQLRAPMRALAEALAEAT